MFDGEKIIKKLKDDANLSRQKPKEYFSDFLRGVWMDNTPEEAYNHWNSRVEQFPWYADNCLYAIRYVLDNPPDDLQEILRNDGWIGFYHEDEEETEFSRDEYLVWLENVYKDFKKIYDDSPSFLENT